MINYKIIFGIFLVLCFKASSQNEITIHFDNQSYEDYHFTKKKSHGFVLLFELEKDKIYHRKDGDEHSIQLPVNFNGKNAAYGFVYFTGKNEGKLINEILFVIDDYQSNDPTFYVDYNNNLDLRDDGSSLKYNNNRNIVLNIPNSDFKDAILTVNLTKRKTDDEENKALEMFFPIYEGKAKLLNIEYWN